MESKYSDTVGYACSYVPAEMILAAGLKPARIIPGGDTGPADARIHPNTCCYAKAILSDLMQGAFSGMRGMVFANSCDAMRKLFDIWTDFDGSPPALLLDVPKKKDPDSIAFFTSELRRASSLLERDFA
ncbi:2-hydroxyacyl-CoA dehydratase, partial [bacterium]|nr:2-hydroxyacyl-CoA dehydratase [bacterium]